MWSGAGRCGLVGHRNFPRSRMSIPSSLRPSARSRERKLQAGLSEVRRRQRERAAQSKSQEVGSSRSGDQPPEPAVQSLAPPTSETGKDPPPPPPAAEVISFYGSQSDRPAPSQGGREVEGSASCVDGGPTATMATTSSAPGDRSSEDRPQGSASHEDGVGMSSQTATPTTDKTADLPSYAPERSEPTGSAGYDHLLEAHEPKTSSCLDNMVVPALMRDIFGSSGEEDGDTGNDIHGPEEAGSTREEIKGEFQKMLATASHKVEGGGRRKGGEEEGGGVPGRKEWVAHPNAPVGTDLQCLPPC